MNPQEKKISIILQAILIFIIFPEFSILAKNINTEYLTKKKKEFIQAYGDLRISNIRIIGLKRTKSSVVTQWLKVSAGDSISKFEPVEFMENLLRLKIFSDISIEYIPGDDYVEIIIRIKEKWTLIPLPIIIAADKNRSAGFFLMDTNFLGYHKTLFLGSMYSNKGWSIMLGYFDHHISFTNFAGSIFLSKKHDFIENSNQKGDVFQSYNQDEASIKYTFGYTFYEFITISLTGSYLKADVSGIDSQAYINQPGAEENIGQGLRIVLKKYNYRFYYNRGIYAAMDINHGFPLNKEGSEFMERKAFIRYTIPVTLGHIITIDITGAYSDMPIVYEYRLGGGTGTKSLPYKQVPADIYSSGTVSYEVPVLMRNWGTITALCFYEYGFFKRNNKKPEDYNGPGAGVRFYLYNIAIPAVGLDGCYNMKAGEYYFSFVAGFQPGR